MDDLASRLTGSADLYQHDGRRPYASINFVTAHDGFTLRDLVSYDGKHNEANGEDGRDGTDDNLSWNCGAEGETGDPSIVALRARQERNILATLLLSAGTPMLCGGDEMGRTQGGNNNVYCQDNEIAWHDWTLDEGRSSLLEYTRRLSRLRREHPLLQKSTFFRGREIRGVGVRDVVWLRPDGQPMGDGDWSDQGSRTLGMFLAGSGLEPADEKGRAQSDDDLLLVINSGPDELSFTLPPLVERGKVVPWELALDTADDRAIESVEPGGTTRLVGRALKLFQRRALGPGGLQAVHGVPTSTYRLQLQPAFGFRAAADVLAYVEALGAGGLYTSPYFRAEKGSLHGYDVVDHRALNPELGAEADYEAFTDGLRQRGMQHILDFVPNHVGVGSLENAWWLDVLENGQSSLFAEAFDVEWSGSSQHKILLPILGRQLGVELEENKIGLVREGGAFQVQVYDRRLPASPRSYAIILEEALGKMGAAGADDTSRHNLESILASIRNLPPVDAPSRMARRARLREKEVIKHRLAEACAGNAAVAQALDEAAASVASKIERMEAFLGEQNYRLSYFRVATEEINYRRFFDINGLAAIRMEDPDVFAAAHARLFELVRAGRVTGIRLDHTDGLYDPYAYFQTLQHGMREALRAAGSTEDKPIYAVAEKILEAGEELPRGWSISGTTGYDFLSAINALWVDPRAEEILTRGYVEITEGSADFEVVLRQAKRDVMEGSFASEIQVLSDALKSIAERTRRARDYTRASLMRVIKETIAAFGVYRTYVRPDGSRGRHDESHVQRAVQLARLENPMVEGGTFSFLEDALLLRLRGDDVVRFAMRFQQLTGPIMAKGVEDTALYRFVRLTSLNEVGCDPGRFATPATVLHEHNAAMLARWPLTMTCTSTHDTKRSEDVRARIAVLSEMPEDWLVFARETREQCEPFTSVVDGVRAPSPCDTYLFVQTVLGAWPFQGLRDAEPRKQFVERMEQYMLKAIHDEKVRSSWTNPNAAYDRAVSQFVHGALESPAVLERFASWVERLVVPGATNSLAQLALRLASPGVPDVYQGSELWDLSLVDPDNRRVVDFALRRQMLEALRGRGEPTVELARDLLRDFSDGGPKLHVTSTGLRLRRSQPELFLDGSYSPLEGSEHIVAFERSCPSLRLVCIVPRLSSRLTQGRGTWPVGEVWGDQHLQLTSPGSFTNVFTGERVEGERLPLAKVLGVFPVAWLLEDRGKTA